MKLEVHYIKGDIIMKSVKAEYTSQTKYCHSWLTGKKVAEYLKTGNMNDIASKVCDIHYDNRKDEIERFISVKASPMSLVLPDSRDKSYLLNIMDTPGNFF